MKRRCESCGSKVNIGDGKWLGNQENPKTLRLHHADNSMCGKVRKKKVLSQEHIAKLQAGRKGEK